MSNLAYAYNDGYTEPYKQEMLDGKIYSMAPPFVGHSRIATKLCSAFDNYLKGKKCEVFMEAGYVYLSKKDKVIPDIIVICNPEIIKRNGFYGAPDLIIEILSASTAKRDRTYKKDLYEKHGVGEYWIVDPKLFTIEIYLLQDEKYVLHDLHAWESEEMLEHSSEDDKANIQYEISPILFPDLVIKMEDIFGGWSLVYKF